jgi:hypothetical protein
MDKSNVEESERRAKFVADAATINTLAPVDAGAATRQRDSFKAAYSGVWVVNVANKDFEPLKCKVPNVRFLMYCRDAAEAREYIDRVMQSGVRAEPIPVPANEPFLIPASLATLHRGHVETKIKRILRRHVAAMLKASRELKERVDAVPPNPNWIEGETALSTGDVKPVEATSTYSRQMQ